MVSGVVAGIVASNMTVSDKIRALDAEGCPRADIARALGKRYQHVRNVLEADKLSRAELPGGVAERSSGFKGPRQHEREVEDRGGGAYRLVVRDDGSVVLPPAVCEAFGLRGRGVVMARMDGDEFKLISTATAMRRIDELMRPYRQQGVSWADELIVERRQEQACGNEGG